MPMARTPTADRPRPRLRRARRPDAPRGRPAARRPAGADRLGAGRRAARQPPGDRQAPGPAARGRPGRGRGGGPRDALPPDARAAGRRDGLDGRRGRALGRAPGPPQAPALSVRIFSLPGSRGQTPGGRGPSRGQTPSVGGLEGSDPVRRGQPKGVRPLYVGGDEISRPRRGRRTSSAGVAPALLGAPQVEVGLLEQVVRRGAVLREDRDADRRAHRRVVGGLDAGQRLLDALGEQRRRRDASASGSSTENSSPPWRATTSLPRTFSTSTRPTSWSRRSPSRWPWVSLISLKRSTSSVSSAKRCGIGGRRRVQPLVELAVVAHAGERVVARLAAVLALAPLRRAGVGQRPAPRARRSTRWPCGHECRPTAATVPATASTARPSATAERSAEGHSTRGCRPADRPA